MDDRNTITTASKQLQQDLLDLHIRCGIMPTFGERPPRTAVLKNGKEIKGLTNRRKLERELFLS